LAVGKEAHRRIEDKGQATALSILASKNVIETFSEKAGSPNCIDITNTDFSKKIQFAKYMIFKARSCFNLADRWTEDAIQSGKEGLLIDPTKLPRDTVSCASEVARKMSANEEEVAAVSGLAGGIGLSGEACGALIAAIWLRSIQWAKENPGKSPYSNMYASNVMFTFHEATQSKFLCKEICGRKFNSVEEYSDYIRKGGCAELIETLSIS
jgi:hypothetical protein